jgi:hypothetical protein
MNGDRSTSWVGISIAGLAPIGVAAFLVPLRNELVNTNLALILVVVVVLTAVALGVLPEHWRRYRLRRHSTSS